jgi:predicted transcriptional regulator
MRGFGDLEAVVMDRVWDHDGPVTVRDILGELSAERSIAYTTVMSTMDNLHRKGWLAREKDGKAYRYRPVATREEYSARLMREAMAGAGDTEAVLTHFVDGMDGGQAQVLRAVLGKISGGARLWSRHWRCWRTRSWPRGACPPPSNASPRAASTSGPGWSRGSPG